ncbi:MAG: 3-oxoacid CoA-transferase, subunit [Lachnospiraceae bacterium]|jgi:acetate CoA/acetoacetate CoA-transferase beta subunit|nr:3-oxoacid CoA-transferase, subunit [Lachnospiraceae bacterium]
MDKELMAKFIAKRISGLLEPGTLVNLGVGLPTGVSDYVGPEREILMHGENGVIGLGKAAFGVINSTNSKDAPQNINADLVINAGAGAVSVDKGAAFFDSTVSFGLIRGGHVDVTVLGTMEVDEEGNIANYMIPGKRVAGMGGAMDLCVGAKTVIVATYHTAGGAPKIVKKCTLPLTAQKAVDIIVTEMGIFDVTPEGIKVREYNPEYTLEQIQAATGVNLIIPDEVATTPAEYFENL